MESEVDFLKRTYKLIWDSWEDRENAEDVGMEKEYDFCLKIKERIRKIKRKGSGK